MHREPGEAFHSITSQPLHPVRRVRLLGFNSSALSEMAEISLPRARRDAGNLEQIRTLS